MKRSSCSSKTTAASSIVAVVAAVMLSSLSATTSRRLCVLARSSPRSSSRSSSWSSSRRVPAAFALARPSTSQQFLSTSSGDGGKTDGNVRRSRAKPTARSLAARLASDPRYAGDGVLRMSTTETEETAASTSTSTASTAADDIESDESFFSNLFPNKGKVTADLPPRMRFAPSPTGSLHVGGARTALYNWLVAKKGQLDFDKKGDGGFVLRVEDTDIARSTKESEDSVLADLSWLGLTWDEGPDTPTAKYGPYRQSERGPMYGRIALRLVDEGKAYPCFCTADDLDQMKAKMEAEGIPPRYDGTWRDADPALVAAKMAEGAPYTVRFKVPAGARVVIDDAVRGTVSWDAEATVGDFILLRSSGVPVYNFCVAVDDASMGITTVIRAEEHLTNTLRQGLILDAIGAPRPRYAHCSLILGEDRQKLSKRHGATSCDQFRLDGFLPDAMINYLALLGWNDGTENEIFTREELVDAFAVNRIVKSPSVFDMDKLKWVNSQHLKTMDVEDILALVREQTILEGLIPANIETEKTDKFIFASTALAKQMMETLRDAPTNAREVLGYALPASFDELNKEGFEEARDMIVDGNFYGVAMKLLEMHEAGTFPMPDESDPLAAFVDAKNKKAIVEDNHLGGTERSYPQEYKKTMKTLAKDLGLKGKCLFHPVRLALSGQMSGQEVTKQLSLLALETGKDAVVDIDGKLNVVVPFAARMEQLKTFCETIPEEFRSRPMKDFGTGGAGSKNDKNKKDENAGALSSAAADSTDPLDNYDGPPITALDVRVGRIQKVWVHEEADKLYCEEIDVGDEDGEPRQIASGLRPYLSAEDLEGRMVLVLCNLKTRKLAGFPSHGMVLCASNQDHTEVKLVSAPVDAKVGERVTVPGFDFESDEAAPYAENKVGKKKVFEKIAPFLKTNEYGVPEFCGRPLLTSAGVCTTPISKGTVS